MKKFLWLCIPTKSGLLSNLPRIADLSSGRVYFGVAILLFGTANLPGFVIQAGAQVFWTEAFQNGCASGCFATSYTGPNGTWTQTSTGTNDAESNQWFVSGTECGNAAGQCGTGCTSTDPSLHVGADDGFSLDPAAAYNAGGFCGVLVCVTTNMRVESPIINCTGQTAITLSFNYIEYGDGTTDDATLWYDDGTGTWTTLLSPLAKTSCCNPTCGGGCTGTQQGCWTAFSIVLPASANNNPNVKIGFNWTNNDDGVGTDPSFAVDDIALSGPVAVQNISSKTSFWISPNPFEKEFTLNFSLVREENVKIDAYNLLGEKMFTLINQKQKAGEHKLKFGSAELENGIYFLKFSTTDSELTQRIVKIY